MDEKLIQKTKRILMEWNPLRERAEEIKDLNDYETEAIDILWHLKKKPTAEEVETITRTVLEQAFDLHLTKPEVMPYSNRIHEEIGKIKA